MSTRRIIFTMETPQESTALGLDLSGLMPLSPGFLLIMTSRYDFFGNGNF